MSGLAKPKKIPSDPVATNFSSTGNTNVVKKWLEFIRAIKRDEVAGRYTERAPKNCTHQSQSIFPCQKYIPVH